MKKYFLLLLTFLFLSFWFACKNDNDDPDYGSCDNIAYLNRSPINLDDISGIVPLGNLNPPDHTLPTRHMYWYTGEPQFSLNQNVSVFSPGDIRIIEIEKVQYHDREYNFDYSFRFRMCNDIGGYFSHFSELDEGILAQVDEFKFKESYSTGTESVSVYIANTDILLNSGDRLGLVSYYGTLDFGMDNRKTKNLVLNEELFDYRKTAANPLDYFTPAVKAEIEEHVGAYDGSRKRTKAPIGGDIVYDQEGTAQGFWVLKNYDKNKFSESQSVCLVWDPVDPDIGAFSVGNVGSIVDGQALYFTPTTSGKVNRKFSQVTPDNQIYTYSFDSVTILIRLEDSNNLTFEVVSSGGNPPSNFTASAIQFKR